MPELLTDDEIEARIAALTEPDFDSVPELHESEEDPQIHTDDEIAARGYKYARPLVDAANGLVDYLQNPEGRFTLGIPAVDLMTRGFGRGELTYVIGHSHSGKTQLLLQGIVNNPDRGVLLFTPDEPAELVLAKLVSIVSGVDADALEARVKAGDPDAVRLVRSVATEQCRNLVVVDEPLSWDSMWDALHEARDLLGSVDVVIFDFLEQLPGGSEDGTADGVAAKSVALKRWIKSADVPGICIHQRSRTSGDRGKPAGMGGMRYGGENDAIFVLEVYRQVERDDLSPADRRMHESTVNVNVCKNKRPPCRKGDVLLHIDPPTGRIRELTEADRRAPTAAETSWINGRNQ